MHNLPHLDEAVSGDNLFKINIFNYSCLTVITPLIDTPIYKIIWFIRYPYELLKFAKQWGIFNKCRFLIEKRVKTKQLDVCLENTVVLLLIVWYLNASFFFVYKKVKIHIMCDIMYSCY